MYIFLASKSPRRAALLEQVGLPFRAMDSLVREEEIDAPNPEILVKKLALAKARALMDRVTDGLIIGADTVVVHGETVMGKPVNAREAAAMLHRLSGSMHRVMTGLAVVEAATGSFLVGREITQVRFRVLADSEIQAYVASGEPLDKAGGYGIQGLGALLVAGVSGCYANVVGLPLGLLIKMLARWGVGIWELRG